jgi:diacylglycerol kinase family enzyme
MLSPRRRWRSETSYLTRLCPGKPGDAGKVVAVWPHHDGSIPIFVNPAAGRRGREEVASVQSVFDQAGLATQVYCLGPAALPFGIRQAVDEGARLIAVSGGDGTLSSAARVLVDGPAALLPVPTGTRNHFARRFGIGDPQTAARAVAAGSIVPCAIGSVNGRPFINNASCGLYPHIVRHRERLRSWLTRPGGFVAGTLAATARMSYLDLVVSVADRRLQRRAPLVWVGLGRGSFRLPEQGRTFANARVLELVIVRAGTRRQFASLSTRVLLRMLRGTRPIRARELEVLHVRGFSMHSDHPIDCALDGEPHRFRPPLRFTLRDRALKVLSPLPLA